MLRDEGLIKLINVVKNSRRHSNYDANVRRAALYHTIVTGEGADVLLKRWVRREDEELFNQRVALTQHIFTTTTKSILDVFNKVPRALYNRVLTYQNNDKNTSYQELEDILSKYYGNASMDDWMATRYLDLNGFDPNAFIVEEFEAFDNKVARAKPYPFEVSSSMAVDYEYKNNILQYLIVKQVKNELDRYTIYMDNQCLIFQQIREDVAKFNQAEGVVYEYENASYIVIGKQVFEFIEPLPYNLGKVPAKQVGIIRAKNKSGDDSVSFVSLFDAAIPFILKSIKTNSELDLVMSNMAFPIKISYVQKCDECEGAKVVDNETCRSCNGTGKKHSTSAMETIEIGMNGNLDNDNVVDLSKLVAFISPPTDIIKLMDDFVDKMTEKAKEIIFNSDIFTKKQIADTATGKMLDSQNVYDALQPVFKAYSDTWEYKIDIISKITDLNRDLIWSFTFNKDAKLKSKTELINDLVLVNSANAPIEIRKDIYNDLARITYSDNPNEYLKYQVKERFNPFSGYSQETITQALLSEFVKKETKVLYYNFTYIFNEVEARMIAAKKDFYALDYNIQKLEVDKIVSELVESQTTVIKL